MSKCREVIGFSLEKEAQKYRLIESKTNWGVRGFEPGTLFLFYDIWFHLCMKFYVHVYMVMYSVGVPPPTPPPH